MVTMDRSFAVQGRYRVEENEDPKTEHEDDHGHITVGQKRKKLLQEFYFQKFIFVELALLILHFFSFSLHVMLISC